MIAAFVPVEALIDYNMHERAIAGQALQALELIVYGLRACLRPAVLRALAACII